MAIKTIKHKQGTDFLKVMTVSDGNVTSLDGYAFRSSIKKNSDQVEPDAEFSFDILDQDDFPMQVRMTLSNDKSSGLPVNPITPDNLENTLFLTDIEVIRPDAVVAGSRVYILEVTPEITT